jgi:hypothetical protein
VLHLRLAIQPPEALSSSPTLSRSGSNCKSTDSTKRTTNTEINPDEIDEREWLTANKGTTGPIDPPLEPPRAPLILKTESTLSIDGGAEERGMYCYVFHSFQVGLWHVYAI